MKRYTHLATQAVFNELDEQGRTQRWLASKLNVWEPRLSDWKKGRREMPDDLVEESFRLLNLSPTALSFFAAMLPKSDIVSPSSDSPEAA